MNNGILRKQAAALGIALCGAISTASYAGNASLREGLTLTSSEIGTAKIVVNKGKQEESDDEWNKRIISNLPDDIRGIYQDAYINGTLNIKGNTQSSQGVARAVTIPEELLEEVGFDTHIESSQSFTDDVNQISNVSPECDVPLRGVKMWMNSFGGFSNKIFDPGLGISHVYSTKVWGSTETRWGSNFGSCASMPLKAYSLFVEGKTVRRNYTYGPSARFSASANNTDYLYRSAGDTFADWWVGSEGSSGGLPVSQVCGAWTRHKAMFTRASYWQVTNRIDLGCSGTPGFN